MAEQRRGGGSERCPRPCSECYTGEHHTGGSYIDFADDEPEHPAATAGVEMWRT